MDTVPQLAAHDTVAGVRYAAPRSVVANGLELTFDVFGEPDAAPMLLIMGLGCQLIAWDERFCAMLAGRGLRVIRFDNRDIGLSTRLHHLGVPDIGALVGALLQGKPVAAPYLLQDMAADAVALLDALGIAAAHVVGVSMGGAIAQEMALRWPRRLLTLTSIMSNTGDPGLPPPTPAALSLLLTPAPRDRDGFCADYPKRWAVLRGPGHPEDEAADAARAARIFDRGIHPDGVARQLAATLASPPRGAALAGLRLPTLVIHGEHDPLVPVAGGRATAAAIPDARLEIVAGMGHALATAHWPAIIEAIATHAA